MCTPPPARAPTPAPRAMPTLVPTSTCWSSTVSGSISVCTTCCAMLRASSLPLPSARMMANSSPPRRATKLSPTRPTSACPTAHSTLSPKGWPNVSLISLNPSRSRQRIARFPSSGVMRFSRLSSCSRKNTRLGRPVRPSLNAMCAIRSSRSKMPRAIALKLSASRAISSLPDTATSVRPPVSSRRAALSSSTIGLAMLPASRRLPATTASRPSRPAMRMPNCSGRNAAIALSIG